MVRRNGRVSSGAVGKGYTVGSAEGRGLVDGRQWPAGSPFDRSGVLAKSEANDE